MMRYTIKSALAVLLSYQLAGCATIYSDASDANDVTFLNSTNESRADLQTKAQAYCMQYGKKAFFRNTDSGLITVFDCKP